MKYNTAGQQFIVAAVNADGFVSGDAANITCTLSVDGGTRSATNDTNPTEIGTSGRYAFTLTQAETAGHELAFVPLSAASGVQVVGLPSDVIYTTREAEIKAKTDIIGTGVMAFVSSPINSAGEIEVIVRGMDYTPSEEQFKTTITAPADAGSVGSCSATFGLYHPVLGVGFTKTGGTVEDLGGGQWQLQSGFDSADTLSLPPANNYEWTHTLVDANGKIRLKSYGTTKVIDHYAVARYSS